MPFTAVSRRTRRTSGLAVVAALALPALGATSASAADAPNPVVQRSDGALVERVSGRAPDGKAIATKPSVKRTRAAQQRMKRAAKRAGVSAKRLSRKQTRHHGSNCAVHVVYGTEVCWWWAGADGYDDIFFYEVYEGGVLTAYGLDYENSLFLDLYALGF